MLTIFLASSLMLPPLPPPQFADTEASTNIVIAALNDYERAYVFKLDFSPSVSNNVELAFGDGTNDYRIVGWDAGAWKNVDCLNEVEAIETDDVRSREWRFEKRSWPSAWRHLRVISRGASPASPVITITREHEFFYIHLR